MLGKKHKSNCTLISPLILLVFGFTLIGMTGVAFTQSPGDLWEVGQKSFAERNFDQAYGEFESAGKIFLTENQPLKYLKCRIEMARCSQFTSVVSRQEIGEIIGPGITLIGQNPTLRNSLEAAEAYQFLARYQWSINGQYDEALLSYQNSLDICSAMGDSSRYFQMSAWSDLSHVYSNREQFDEALQYAQKALNISQQIYGQDDVENGPRYFSLGFAYYRKGYLDEAIEVIKKGIEILEDKDGPDMQIGLGYNNLTAVYVAKLDQEGARQSALAAEKILSKYLGPDHEAIGIIYFDLGSMYSDLGEYQLAEENLHKAIGIFQKKFGTAYPQFPQLFHQLGYCYDQTGRFSEAEEWHKKAYQLNINSFGSKHPRTGDSFRQLAHHYILEGNVEQAKWAIDKGMLVVENKENQSSMLRAGLYEEKGEFLRRSRDWQGAIDAYDQAILSICTPDYPLEALTVDQSFNPLYYSQFNSEKAKIQFLAFQENQDTTVLFAALNTARKAHQGIRKLRSSYQGAQSKLFLQKRARDHYNLMLEMLFVASEIGDDRKWLAEAWQISEQSKSLLLLEEIKRAQLTYSGIPQQMTDSLARLRQDLNLLQETLAEWSDNGDSATLADKQLKFIRLQNEIYAFEDLLHDKYPQFNSVTQDLFPVELHKICSLLPKESALWEYYLGDSSIFIFQLAEDPHWQRISVSQGFIERLNQYRNEVRNLESILKNPDEALARYDQSGKALFSVLIPQSLLENTSIKNVVIVPDQELGYISFEGLKNPANNRYLLEDYAITYAYSGTLYGWQLSQASNIVLKDFAGFAPSYSPPDSANYLNDLAVTDLYRAGRFDLPGARQEVEQISRLVDGDVWVGEEATETRFKEIAPNRALLHLSLHGMIDEDDPMHSRL
ncbi:MAG: tetratricopeptide repeat protein, partial [Saprospiraceae bacterium]|nr:tetratricopeptide repeat protein [Saprospiraceae bacterium]